jgi:hypothetical protein
MFPLNEHTRWILGRPNFTLAGVFRKLRDMGVEIATKAEDEQAVSIYWMLCLHERHGDDWRVEGDKVLNGEQSCNRKACGKLGGAAWWNSSTRAYYCADCAKAINEHNPGLCGLLA